VIRLSRSDFAWLALILAGLLIIYLPGLGNPLVFDDTFLTEGNLQADFGAFHLRPRALSYGTFLWLQALVGEGWWKQRLFNLLLHMGVVVSLWALYREILRAIAPASSTPGAVAYEDSPALGFAIAFFALNPVAVYAVAYLIQRSILMATLFAVLGLWLFARGVRAHKLWSFAGAAVCYGLALLSKEHAILAPLAAVPLYILIARPSAKRLAALAALSSIVIAAVTIAMWGRYGWILAAPFDEYSRVYLSQLSALNPDASKHAYALSVVNETYLFFQYGLRWLFPYDGWMSIALRPPFPITWTTLPQAIGIVSYAVVITGGFFLLIRYRDWRALIAVSALFAALLFATELATVWVQDPFVLYRSYLWAIGIPGLVFFLAHGPSGRALLAIGLVVAILLVWQALDRVLSMDSAERLWTDAIEKLPDDPRAVGRWFPYLNRGAEYVERDRFDLAMLDFERSAALGDLGMGRLNMGSLLARAGKHERALKEFDEAERQGLFLSALFLQRGLSLAALGKTAEAYDQLDRAKYLGAPSGSRELLLLQLGRLGLQLGKREAAIKNLEELVRLEPKNNEVRYLLGMAYVMQGEHQRAFGLLDSLVRDDPNGRSFYARAMANYAMGRKAQALADIDNAIRLWPDNPALHDWQARIRAMP
jgi:tetratricopeptide (TPR) repeat protein